MRIPTVHVSWYAWASILVPKNSPGLRQEFKEGCIKKVQPAEKKHKAKDRPRQSNDRLSRFA